MKKFTAVTVILLFALTFSTYGQLAIGFNTDGNTLCLSTNPLLKFWGEFRVNTKAYNQAGWSYSDRGITQAYLIFNLFKSEYASLYCGTGIGANLLSAGNDKWLSVNVPLGIKINPFAKLPDLFITGEYNPMIIAAEDIPIIHSVSLGFRYIISRKE